MILVTGSHGFIGQHLCAALIADGQQVAISDPRFGLPLFKTDGEHRPPVEAIFHLGAISDTTCTDWTALYDTNVALSQRLWEFCTERKIPLLYASSASVYGNGSGPLNLYAQSKYTFDKFAESAIDTPSHWYGLRFTNVYGPGEEHKGKQASMVHQLAQQSKERGRCEIFAAAAKRDFVHVDDVVSVMLWMWKSKPTSGIYDVGTGNPASFYELGCQFPGHLDIIEMPESLEGKYQTYTCADLTKLRAAGYDKAFISLSEGVARCLAR